MAEVLDEPEVTDAFMRSLCPIVSTMLLAEEHSSGSVGDGFVYAAAPAQGGNSDNPSYRAAMSGPERSLARRVPIRDR